MRKYLNRNNLAAFLYCMHELEKSQKTQELLQDKEFERTLRRFLEVERTILTVDLVDLEKDKERVFELKSLEKVVHFISEEKYFETYIKNNKKDINDYYKKLKITEEYIDHLFNKYFITSTNNPPVNCEQPSNHLKPKTEPNNNSLKIALVDIKEYQMEGSISKDELVTDILKTNIEEVYIESNRNIIINHYSYSDYKKIKDDNINYDLIIKGRSSYVDNERISRIQFQATRKNSDLETDYNKNIDSIYKIDKFCFLGEGKLPANINFITKWVLALDYYFKEELTKCLPLVLELENMLSADKQDTFKEIDIGHVEVQFLKAVIFMLQDQQYDALEIFKVIEANHINYLKNNSHILSKLHHNIGILEKVKGNLKVAVKHFENAISSKENQWQSYWELARIAAYKKKKENTDNIIIKKDYQYYYTKAFEYSGLNHIKEELELIIKNDFKIINTIKDYINETSINRNNKDIVIKGKE
ncbi:hypothetical protein Q4Q39_13795 [Flavivirga amylovorans]|uniref:Tetratricopeptide repeat protein n=1 Tax=Flavivirga amylovorans TaxID=870486 RepID=A0ABT8X3E0_9FLAO|nr:hypothetical protein [Flavivirga amylovorans]MDO5988481.1 hypothetical protein [Flavivirga amylovorans]